MKLISSKSGGGNLSGIIWKLIFLAGILMFLLYGLSFFLAKPTVETITTKAPHFDPNKQPMQDAKYANAQRKN